MTLAQEPGSKVESELMLLPMRIQSEEPPLETDRHLRQIILLLECLAWIWRNRTDYYAAGNLTIYFSPRQIKTQDFRGPDFFVVLGTENRSRDSWVVWAEDGKYPNVIVELLSESTEKKDRTLKKQIYQDTFRTPEYFWFDPRTLELVGWILMGGVYQPIEPNASGYLWSQQLELYLGVHNDQLRYFEPSGTLVPTPQEAAAAGQVEREQALQEREQAFQDREQAFQDRDQALQDRAQALQDRDRLAARLRELGLDPEVG